MDDMERGSEGRDRPYEPPGVEDLGTLEEITGTTNMGALTEGMGVKT